MTKETTSPWMPVAILLGVLLIASFIFNAVLVFKVMDNNGGTQQGGQVYVPPSGDQPTQPAAPTGPVKIDLGDAPREGSSSAKVTVVEFSDFQCPFCGRYYENVYPSLKKDYIDTGKVQFVYKQFPLTSIHPYAQKAAEASLCAKEQNKFWEMHDKLFANQNALTTDNLKQYASEIGLDTAKFNSCLDSGKMASKVSAETAQGTQAGVSGTPTSFINGKKIVGAVPYDSIKAEIDAALAQ